MGSLEGHALYALAWVSFGAGHSLLAAPAGRYWLTTRFGPAHRLAYNAVALIHVTAVWAVGWRTLGPASPSFTLPVSLIWVQHGLFVVGVGALVLSLRSYDIGRLLGTAQVRAARTDTGLPEDEPLRLDGPHRWVRHPLYLAGFMILWGRAVDPFGLATAVWGSAYLVVGTVFEERKLLRLYGAAYADYRRCVPMFLPWKGRAWPPDAARPPAPAFRNRPSDRR